jgi:CRP-like cAMP-binding protein
MARQLTAAVIFRRGALLLGTQALSTHLYFIKTGLVQASQVGPDGVSRAIGIFGQGHLLGQLGLVGQHSVMSFTALTDVAVCETNHEALKASGWLSASFAQAVGKFNAAALAALAGWSHIMRIPQLRTRVGAAMLLLAREQGDRSRILLPQQALLAELLGTTRESIGRALSELEAWGAVGSVDRGQLDLNIPRLLTLVCPTQVNLPRERHGEIPAPMPAQTEQTDRQA